MSRALPCLASQFLVLTLIVGALSPKSTAQLGSEPVHITPPSKSSGLGKGLAGTEPGGRSFKSIVDLVLVPVTVTDSMNHVVVGLDSGNFQVFENKKLQVIRNFSNEDAPISIGLILDASNSMQNKFDNACLAVLEFLKTANAEDEFFLITFSEHPVEEEDFTASAERIQDALLRSVPAKSTALLDAVYLGLAKMRTAKYPRRALLIISDGGDNHSRYTEGEVRKTAEEADVAIYAIGLYDSFFSTEEERLGPALLADLSQVTGGFSFIIDNQRDLVNAAAAISLQLRNRYLIGYRPETIHHDGKWHKITVKVKLPKKIDAKVQAKTGYYAPAE